MSTKVFDDDSITPEKSTITDDIKFRNSFNKIRTITEVKEKFNDQFYLNYHLDVEGENSVEKYSKRQR